MAADGSGFAPAELHVGGLRLRPGRAGVATLQGAAGRKAQRGGGQCSSSSSGSSDSGDEDDEATLAALDYLNNVRVGGHCAGRGPASIRAGINPPVSR